MANPYVPPKSPVYQNRPRRRSLLLVSFCGFFLACFIDNGILLHSRILRLTVALVPVMIEITRLPIVFRVIICAVSSLFLCHQYYNQLFYTIVYVFGEERSLNKWAVVLMCFYFVFALLSIGILFFSEEFQALPDSFYPDTRVSRNAVPPANSTKE